MRLSREGERLIGTYSYQKIGTQIDLKGTIDKEGHFTLEEFDKEGKQTGLFTGLWILDQDSRLTKLAGNWNKPGGSSKTAFSLHEEPIDFSSPVEIVDKQINEDNKKGRYKIEAEYPQLSAANPNFEKFNQEIKNRVTGKVLEFRKDMKSATDEEADSESAGSDLGIGYTIALANDDLISVEIDVGSYYRGAAHPNSHTEVVNFDLKNGKMIKLAGLFKNGAKYLQKISAYCVTDLKKQSKTANDMLDDESIANGAGPEAKNYNSWTINRKGLGINFDAYQVGPYAAGPQYVLLPYSAIKDIIDPEGPLGQFVK